MGDYISPTFDPIGPLKSFYGVPRFGHSSDITDIFTDEGDLDFNKIFDYLMGTIFVAAFLLATFLVFVFFLLVFKIVGRDAGILGGFPFVEDKKLLFGRPKKNLIFRCLMLLLTSIVVAGGGVFLGKGTQQVRRVASDVRDGTTGFKSVSQKVVDTADLMIDFGETSVPLRDNLIDTIGQGLCQSFEGGNANPQDDFDQAATQLVGLLNDMQNFARNELVVIRDVFATDIIAMANQMGNTTDTTEIIANPAYYALPAITLGGILFIGTLLAWNDVKIPGYFCLQTWLILPLFLILILASIAVITAVGAVLVANSDFCIGNSYGSPEGTLKHVLDVFDLDNNTLGALNYYIIDGCRGEYNNLVAIEDLLSQLSEGTESAKDLQQLISEQQLQLEIACGGQPGSLDPLQNTITLTLEAFEDVMAIGDSTTDLLSCQDINSIWIDIVHDAVCTSAPSAFTWMFASITAVYASGILIFLFRGVLLPSIDFKDYARDDDSYTDDEMLY